MIILIIPRWEFSILEIKVFLFFTINIREWFWDSFYITVWNSAAILKFSVNFNVPFVEELQIIFAYRANWLNGVFSCCYVNRGRWTDCRGNNSVNREVKLDLASYFVTDIFLAHENVLLKRFIFIAIDAEAQLDLDFLILSVLDLYVHSKIRSLVICHF